MAKVEGYKAADLAEELGISAADLRKHLRALKIEKPEAGWVWPKKTDAALKEIRTAVKNRIKELADKPAKESKPAAKKTTAKKKAAVKETAEETSTEDSPKPKAKARSRKAKKTSDAE